MRILCLEPLAHDLCPHPPRRPKLGDFLKKIVVRIEEKRNPRRHIIDVEAARNTRFQVRNAVSQRKRNLLCGSRSSLSDVLAANGDDIPFGRMGLAKIKNVRHQAHGRFGRVNISATSNVFLKDIVLDRSGEPSDI